MAKNISADFPYESRFVEILGSRMHYVEHGEGDPVLFLHGNPTWSYLWRNVIPPLSRRARCIALDLAGFGKSDKPDIEYRFFDHTRYVEAFIEAMGLKNLTLVLHDWGSALGFYYAMRNEANLKGMAFMEAIFMPFDWEEFPEEVRDVFKAFRTPQVGWDMIVNKNLFIEEILFSKGVIRDLSEREKEAYMEPFRDPVSRKPIWRWPNEIPIEGEPRDVGRYVNAYKNWLQGTEIPKLLLYATPGALVPESLVDWCRAKLKNLSIAHLGEGVHYLQEDNPHKIGSAIAEWYGNLLFNSK